MVDREVSHGRQRLAAGPTYPGAVGKTGEGHIDDHRTRLTLAVSAVRTEAGIRENRSGVAISEETDDAT